MGRLPPLPIDYTNIGYESLRDAMLAQARASVPEWTDFSENDLGVLLIELFAFAADITLYYQTRIAGNLFPATADEPEGLVQLLRLIGYELSPPAPATAELRLTFEPTVTGPIVLPAATRFQATPPSGEALPFETEREVVVQDAQLSPFDGTPRRYLLPLPVIQGETQPDESLGASDGSPNQLFVLAKKPVIAGSVVVTVDEQGLPTRWEAVESLGGSSPADRLFVVQRDAEGAGTIVFGDGVNGMIPPPAATPNIRATYRIGGGPQGNIPAQTQFRLAVPAALVPSLREAVNDQAAAGGAPREDIDRARRLAPRLYRAQERAVTRSDYEDLALQVPGVGKARAVALSWNDVVLYVAPAGQVAEPSELLKRDVLAYFESRRMATTFPRILGPRAADIYIRADVQAQPYFRQADVRAAVEKAVADYLAFDEVSFGDRIYLSRLYDAIQDLPQVISLNITEFSRTPGGGIESNGVIELRPNELPRPGYRDNPPPPLTERRPILANILGGVS